ARASTRAMARPIPRRRPEPVTSATRPASTPGASGARCDDLSFMPVISLVRHAQASFGSVDYDVLSELGHRQAALLDAALAARGVAVQIVRCGSLRRQLDTALACPLAARGPVVRDPRWDEYDSADVMTHHAAVGAQVDGGGIGAPAGMTSQDFQGMLDGALLDWIAAGDRTPCQESWPAFRGRATGALQELAAGLGSGEDALVFSSGGTIAALAAALLDAPDTVFVALNKVAVNTSVAKVMVGRTGLRLLSYNEHTHLEHDRALMSFR
ncbi:MAG: histidine phosphatase family protein, partial [Solirubrobacterales bacterium]|nr:histidine phosphatase family protein [Solirubrobacterales bacterium]